MCEKSNQKQHKTFITNCIIPTTDSYTPIPPPFLKNFEFYNYSFEWNNKKNRILANFTIEFSGTQRTTRQ